MPTASRKTDQTPQNKANANDVSQQSKGASVEAIDGQKRAFEDHRPEAVSQRTLQALADESPQVKRAAYFHDLANNSPKVAAQRKIQAMADARQQAQAKHQQWVNNSPSPVAQRNHQESLFSGPVQRYETSEQEAPPVQRQIDIGGVIYSAKGQGLQYMVDFVGYIDTLYNGNNQIGRDLTLPDKMTLQQSGTHEIIKQRNNPPAYASFNEFANKKIWPKVDGLSTKIATFKRLRKMDVVGPALKGTLANSELESGNWTPLRLADPFPTNFARVCELLDAVAYWEPKITSLTNTVNFGFELEFTDLGQENNDISQISLEDDITPNNKESDGIIKADKIFTRWEKIIKNNYKSLYGYHKIVLGDASTVTGEAAGNKYADSKLFRFDFYDHNDEDNSDPLGYWWFQLDLDEATIEIRTKPVTLQAFQRDVSVILSACIFNQVAGLGLSADRETGAGHISVDRTTGFGDNTGVFLSFLKSYLADTSIKDTGGTDVNIVNAPWLDELETDTTETFKQVLREDKGKEFGTVLNTLHNRVFTGYSELGLELEKLSEDDDDPHHYHAINTSNMNTRTSSKNRLELRRYLAQESSEELGDQLSRIIEHLTIGKAQPIT